MMAEKRVHPEGSTDEWHTPWWLFEQLNQEFQFTVDVASADGNAKVARYLTKEDDGLSQSWSGDRVWCNPPYSDIAPWVAKAAGEIRAGCQLVAMLLPAVKTEQPWWQAYIEPMRDGRSLPKALGFTVETRFIGKRFKFGFPGDPSGAAGTSPKFGCVLVIWRAVS